MLTRDQILSAEDRARELVEVPEWGGSVYVSVMSGTARDAWEAALLKDGKPDLEHMRAKLAAATIVDELGACLFSPADVAALSSRSSVALDRIITVARRLNKLGIEGFEAAKGN